jgi:hypothetical protein
VNKTRGKGKRNRVGETSCFDALIEGFVPWRKKPDLFLFCHPEGDARASLHWYEDMENREKESAFVQVRLSQSFLLKWRDAFSLRRLDTNKICCKGIVLDPFADKISRKETKRKFKYFKQLLGGEKNMLLALCQSKGIHGLWEKEMVQFASLSIRRLVSFSQELEAEGQIRILSFSPLFLISQSSFLFLCEKILSHLRRFHEKHADMTGVHREKIRKRFDLHPRIFSLALRYLGQEKRIKVIGDQLALADFKMTLLPEEEKILNELEEMCLEG